MVVDPRVFYSDYDTFSSANSMCTRDIEIPQVPLPPPDLLWPRSIVYCLRWGGVGEPYGEDR